MFYPGFSQEFDHCLGFTTRKWPWISWQTFLGAPIQVTGTVAIQWSENGWFDTKKRRKVWVHWSISGLKFDPLNLWNFRIGTSQSSVGASFWEDTTHQPITLSQKLLSTNLIPLHGHTPKPAYGHWSPNWNSRENKVPSCQPPQPSGNQPMPLGNRKSLNWEAV